MKSLGDTYEQRAAAWLERRGMQLLHRNVRARTGEIDLVAVDGDCLVFVEVRARRDPRYESAAGSVNRHKQRRLVRTARWFLQRHPRLADRPCRFDVVAFEPPKSGPGLTIRWIRGAFTA